MSTEKTYESILKRMLRRVTSAVDKREGSLIYDAMAPAAAEMAQMYDEIEINKRLAFADTATGEYLTRIAQEFGVNRFEATKAKRKGIFTGAEGAPVAIPLGSRFRIGDLTYITQSEIVPGEYVLECETPGVVGNQLFGALLPIQYIPGLSKGTLAEVLIPGEDEETDDELRSRFFEVMNEPAFGGNVADYKNKINQLPGVGGVKVFPTWQGGGTVKCTLISSDYLSPSDSLLETVQETIDPVEHSGEGLGLAPIGHQVTIMGVTGREAMIETTLTLQSGITLPQVQEAVERVIEEYLLELRKRWAQEGNLVVRIAQIEARIIGVPGVADVGNTTINGVAENFILGAEEIPLLQGVTLHESN